MNPPSDRDPFLTCHVGRRKISLSTQQNATPDLIGCSKSRSATTEQPPSQNTYTLRIPSSRQGRASTTWVSGASPGASRRAGVGGVSLRRETVPAQWAGPGWTQATDLLSSAFPLCLRPSSCHVTPRFRACAAPLPVFPGSGGWSGRRVRSGGGGGRGVRTWGPGPAEGRGSYLFFSQRGR